MQAAVHWIKKHWGENMRLRFSTSLITGAVLAVSSLAHAIQPKTSSVTVKTSASAGNTSVKVTPSPVGVAAPSINVGALAQVEGILTYCGRVDPKSSEQYRQVLKAILSGLRESDIDDDQENPTFVSDERAVSAQLAKIPRSTGVSGCRTILR